MESTPGSRLAEWREFKGMTLAEMASITGISKTTINTVEQSGSSKPSYDTISRVLAGFPDLNPDWLLLGTGPMVRGRGLTPATPVVSTPTAAEEPTAAYGCLAPDLVSTLRLENIELRTENKALRDELRQARSEFRADFIAQARQYNSVKVSQEELIARLYTKLDEYELRLGYRQPTQQEREQMQAEPERKPITGFLGQRYSELLEALTTEAAASTAKPEGKHFYLKAA